MMLAIFITLFIFFNLVFFIAVKKRDFSIIDIAWGLSFFLIFITSYFSSEYELTTRGCIIGLLVTIWSFRLSGYIFLRALKKGKEDFRYAAWREDWGSKANQTAYTKVFMLQLILSVLIASPIILYFIFSSKSEFGTFKDILGLGFWIVGFFFEAVGDYQKNKFKSVTVNKDKFCNVGLWKYTRHPNYFGEALLWWGIFFITINSVPFYYAVWGPLLLNFLLLKVSGVAMLEESYEKRAGFEEYKQTTNRFIPWFSKGKI